MPLNTTHSCKHLEQHVASQPVVTIRANDSEVVHEQSIQELEQLKIPKNEVKTLVQQIHQNFP